MRQVLILILLLTTAVLTGCDSPRMAQTTDDASNVPLDCPAKPLGWIQNLTHDIRERPTDDCDA